MRVHTSQGNLLCFGRFSKTANAEGAINEGGVIGKEQILGDMRTTENLLATWWPGFVALDYQTSNTIPPGGASASFEFNSDKKGWHYGFNSNRFSNDEHEFVVHFFKEDCGKSTLASPKYNHRHSVCSHNVGLARKKYRQT
jgi:hypothetical protein